MKSCSVIVFAILVLIAALTAGNKIDKNDPKYSFQKIGEIVYNRAFYNDKQFPDTSIKFLEEPGQQTPEIIKTVAPEYPEAARIDSVECTVIIEIMLTAEGKIPAARVDRCTAPGYGFEQAALNAIFQWEWDPPKFNGKAVSAQFPYTIQFLLD